MKSAGYDVEDASFGDNYARSKHIRVHAYLKPLGNYASYDDYLNSNVADYGYIEEMAKSKVTQLELFLEYFN